MATSMESAGSHAGKSPEQLEREINQTRDHVDDTVRVLVERLSPGQLVDQGIEYLRGADVARGARIFATNLGRTVRENPVPSVMVAAGFVWLAAANGSSRDGASGLAERAEDQLSGLEDGAAGTVRRLREGGGRLTRRTSRGLDRARRGWDAILREQPLVLGLAGLVIGALVGAALPPTEQEDEWMGEARDTAVAKASEAGRELAQEVTSEPATGRTGPQMDV